MEEKSAPQINAEGIQAIVEKLKKTEKITVKTQTNPAVLGYILSMILASKQNISLPVLVVVSDEYAKFNLKRIINIWRKGKKIDTPLFSDTAPLALEFIKQERACLVILSEDDIKSPIPTEQAIDNYSIKLKVGKNYKKERLLKNLIETGYSIDRNASEPGIASHRGSIVDVFPSGEENLIRIDFFDEQIESIKTFSKKNQKTKFIKEIKILPHKIDHLPQKGSFTEYSLHCCKIVFESFSEKWDVSLNFKSDEVLSLVKYSTPKKDSYEKLSKDLNFIKKLKIGDYVVHADHGIGKFEGMVDQSFNGSSREYFKLIYAEGDKLFVPVTLAEKLEKYIGQVHPTLNRLSGASWQNTVYKVKMDTLREAKDLLNTHAKRQLAQSPVILRSEEIEKMLEKTFPYQATEDQKKTIEKVYEDLNSHTPMDRLVCGDVGFGKTEIAIRAATKACLAGFQVAILAPTTILAQQHYDTFSERIKDFPIKICSLSRFQSKNDQKNIVKKLEEGSADIVIGTHRLLSSDIRFANLGVIIIDEEQRFGVAHKEQLKKIKNGVHVLTLSATPIPRTLHLSLSGVKNISVITTPPHGRLPIETYIQPHNQTKIKEAIEKELKRSGQLYYLYNNIQTIKIKEKELNDLVPKARIGVLHGQLPEYEVANVMHNFDRKKIDLLVCSTIIENGLDLPNVNTLVVDNAVQFGLAQLHQIRGRIGRGSRQAYAYLFFKRQKLTGEAEKRLHALEEAHNLGAGFELAMKDMEIRGVGNILGKRQHGHVKSIGLGLYLKLLAQSVEEIKTGEPPEILADITVDLPIEARIPVFFEKDKERRIELYHQWALINNLDELEREKEEVQKEGALPKALENLFYILRLKILGRIAGITSLDTASTQTSQKEYTLILSTKKPMPPKKFAKLLDVSPEWVYATDELKIPAGSLGEDWMRKLEQCLHALAENVE